MSKTIHAVRVVDHVEMLNNSHSGNPRYSVHFTDGTIAQTQADAACNYGIENPEMRSPNEVCVTFTSAGRISHMTPKEVN